MAAFPGANSKETAGNQVSLVEELQDSDAEEETDGRAGKWSFSPITDTPDSRISPNAGKIHQNTYQSYHGKKTKCSSQSWWTNGHAVACPATNVTFSFSSTPSSSYSFNPQQARTPPPNSDLLERLINFKIGNEFVRNCWGFCPSHEQSLRKCQWRLFSTWRVPGFSGQAFRSRCEPGKPKTISSATGGEQSTSWWDCNAQSAA